MYLYCEYEAERWNVGGYDPDDSWSRDSYDGDYHVTGVHLSTGPRDEVETPADETIEVGDTVHVAYVVYTSGDTFGFTGGYSSLLVASKDPDVAHDAAKWANGVDNFETCTRPWAKGMENPPYPNWVGYFEHIDAVRVGTFEVQP